MAELSQILVGGTNFTNTDTKNTAGSTDTSSKIFLIGATSQAANPQTYSQDTAYVGTDGCLYSGGSKVLTSHQSVTNKDATLAWSTKSTIATIGSTDITVSLPANPNTDEKVLQTLSNTNADRRLLFSYSENDNDSTNKVYKSTYLRCNPDYGQLRCVNDKGTVDWEIMAAPASTFTADRVRLTLGNSTANSGSGGCRYGELFIYGGGSYRAAFKQPDITADRDFYFPDASGTLALSGGTVASGQTKSVSGDTVYSYLNSNWHYEENSNTYTSHATNLVYTGAHITIPANSYYIIQGILGYSNSQPLYIGLSTSSTTYTGTATAGHIKEHPSDYTPKVTHIGKTSSSSQTFYLWGKNDQTFSNSATINAIYWS